MDLEFARRVYSVVKKIPKGKVSTYKEIAIAIGKPRAWRAVGNVLNKNRDPTVPCHRVVRTNLSIGGYSKGTKVKISRLIAEGIRIKNNKVQKKFLFTFPLPK